MGVSPPEKNFNARHFQLHVRSGKSQIQLQKHSCSALYELTSYVFRNSQHAAGKIPGLRDAR